MFRGPSIWTPERTDRLKQLWSDGLSASQVAAALDIDITRNGIIGKVHRLGLCGAPRVAAPPRPKPPKVRKILHPRPLEPRDPFHRKAACKQAPLPTEPVEDQDIPIEQRRTLMQLDASTCRWPVGTPGVDLFFCGAGPIDGSPYCEHHTRRSTNPGSARRAHVSEGLR